MLLWKYTANLQENTHVEVRFIEIALRHGCSSVNLLDIFRTPFPKNTSGRLLLFLFYVRKQECKNNVRFKMWDFLTVNLINLFCLAKVFKYSLRIYKIWNISPKVISCTINEILRWIFLVNVTILPKTGKLDTFYKGSSK